MDPLTILATIIGIVASIVTVIAFAVDQLRNRSTRNKVSDTNTEVTDVTDVTDVSYSSLPRINYFFGREEELARVRIALSSEVRGWGVLIDGPGGIGKTTLAIHAGHIAPNKDFPIKVFLSAQNRRLTAIGVQQLLDFVAPDYTTLISELGRELGYKGIEAVDPNQRSKEVRELLKAKKVLVVIDGIENFDIEEESRLFEFLHHLPTDCKAIVTSRRRNGSFADVIRLDRMSYVSAEELINPSCDLENIRIAN